MRRALIFSFHFRDFFNFFGNLGLNIFHIRMGMIGNGNGFSFQCLGIPKYLGILGMGMEIPTVGTSLGFTQMSKNAGFKVKP